MPLSPAWLRFRTIGVLFIFGLLAAALSGCAQSPALAAPEPAQLQIEGVITNSLSAQDLGETAYGEMMMLGRPEKTDAFLRGSVGESCTFPHNLAGAEVLVSDPGGKVLALGYVASDSAVVPSDTENGLILSVECQWKFRVADVPKINGVYAVSVDGSREAHFSAEELGRPMRLSLG